MNTADRFISNYNIMFMDDEEVIADEAVEVGAEEEVVEEVA